MMGKRLNIGGGMFAAYFPQERPLDNARVKVWTESGFYLGVGVGVSLRGSGGAIRINGKTLDSNNVLHWVNID